MPRLKAIRLTASANLKITLVVFALVIVAGTLLYTQGLVTKLKESERRTINFFATSFQQQFNTAQSGTDNSDFIFQLTNVIDFPMIITDAEKTPLGYPGKDGKITYTAFVKNVSFDSLASPEEQEQELKARIKGMAQAYQPLAIYDVSTPDSALTNYIFYDESALIDQLRWLPYVELTIGAMFILVGYLSFSHIKRNEQSNIWVGMAKETAHQLGTPLSSLMGWVELLRMMPEDTTQVLEAAGEMERDVDRLNKVAQRFSKIGSAAEVKPVDIAAVIANVLVYFERRLPHLGKRVILELDAAGPVWVAINVDLFEWVFENLVRNAVDAIDRNDGLIRFSASESRGYVTIDIADNGRGIDPKIRNDIFRPGFSTKTRGWGLGLSLAKRIVEEYHGGKITIKESSAEGTTFRIRLDAVAAPGTPVTANGHGGIRQDVSA